LLSFRRRKIAPDLSQRQSNEVIALCVPDAHRVVLRTTEELPAVVAKPKRSYRLRVAGKDNRLS
jgi:hypothetical protein